MDFLCINQEWNLPDILQIRRCTFSQGLNPDYSVCSSPVYFLLCFQIFSQELCMSAPPLLSLLPSIALNQQFFPPEQQLALGEGKEES